MAIRPRSLSLRTKRAVTALRLRRLRMNRAIRMIPSAVTGLDTDTTCRAYSSSPSSSCSRSSPVSFILIRLAARSVITEATRQQMSIITTAPFIMSSLISP